MSASFGRKKQSQSGSSKPFFKSTGYSSYNGKKFTLDPSIRRMQDTASQKYASIYGDVGQATDRFLTQNKSLRDRFMGDSGSFMESRLRPVRERFNSLRGEVQQNLGQRGLSGSSFQNNALSDIDKEASMAEGDALAQANQERFMSEAGLNESELNALNQSAAQRAALTGETLEVARMRLAQEMGIFGLGTNQKQSASSSGFGLDSTFKMPVKKG